MHPLTNVNVPDSSAVMVQTSQDPELLRVKQNVVEMKQEMTKMNANVEILLAKMASLVDFLPSTRPTTASVNSNVVQRFMTAFWNPLLQLFSQPPR